MIDLASPCAPLLDRSGWRVWYSQKGDEDFEIPRPVVMDGSGGSINFEFSSEDIGSPSGLMRRAKIGTIRLRHPDPELSYRVSLTGDAKEPLKSWRCMPTTIDDKGVTFLFGSCYWLGSDKHGAYGAATRDLISRYRPSFRILAGDQVYQDWPRASLGLTGPNQWYANRYEQYWRNDAYKEALQACPSFFVCDDHEYWNDYPERQMHLPWTWPARGREDYGAAAKATYDYYQRCLNPASTDWTEFSVGKVGFFIADSRSGRSTVKDEHPRFFDDAQWDALVAWAKGLQGPGVLVLGQPFYQRDGDWRDHSLSNFEKDYRRLCTLLSDVYTGWGDPKKRHEILILSGDIHVGRLVTGNLLGMRGVLGEISEFIASPAAKIFPSGGSAKTPPARIPEGSFARVITIDKKATSCEGNNIGMVRMTPGTDGRIRFELTLWRFGPTGTGQGDRLLEDSEQPMGTLTKAIGTELKLV